MCPECVARMHVDSTPPSVEEKERAKRTAEDARFSRLVMLDNFDARIESRLPPTGYSAAWKGSTPFDAHVFDSGIFRGVAGVTTSVRRPPNDFSQIFTRLNLVVPDASPVPPPSKGWVASLGPFGWMGLYSTPEGKRGLTAIVVSGLDAATYERFRTEAKTWHRVLTVAEAYKRMRPYKEIAERNRRRLLSALLHALDEKSYGTEISDDPYEVRATRFVSTEVWPNVRLPAWFVLPTRLPRDVPAVVEGYEPGLGASTDSERYPYETKPEFDVCVNDLVESREGEYVRLSGAADYRGPYLATVFGPLDDVFVWKNETPPSPRPETLGAVPAQAIQKTGAATLAIGDTILDAVARTWEDADLEKNRVVESDYTFRNRRVPDAPAYSPYFVRVSCVDSTGRAEPDRSNRRLACLSVDDYVPIGR